MEKKSIDKDELKNLLEMYDIGKKPLAKLLGWGETTIVLYAGMKTIPDNEYTQKLYQLYRDKNSFQELLINNGDRITGVAYRKSLTKLYKPILESRILLIAQYIIDTCPGTLSQAHLDVILLWSQILSLKFLGKPVFDDIYQPTKGNGNSPYKTVAEGFKNSVFFSNSTLSTDKLIDEQTKEIISFVSEMFSWYGERAFNSLLAAERFRLCGPPQEKTRRSVSNELMKKIYGELFEQAKVKKIKDVETFIFKRLETIRKKTVSSLTDKEKKVPLN
jgi:hypothetical protein